MRRNNSETQASLGTDPTPVPFACSPGCSGARARSWPSQEECPRVSVYVSSSCSVIFFLEMGWGPKASVQISHHLSADYFTYSVSNGPGQTTKEEKAIRRSLAQQSWVSLFCWPLSLFSSFFFLTGQLRILPEPGTQYSYLVNVLSWSTQDWTDQILLCWVFCSTAGVSPWS